jgi:hypothetical protein
MGWSVAVAMLPIHGIFAGTNHRFGCPLGNLVIAVAVVVKGLKLGRRFKVS